ncbi:MAG: UDP-N-acetylmuramate:L-alanyl-gamma-D-glutamyl-meso-diaminopimelate ligase [Deltaproteobacteria bacterium]|nr:UDP-N-acetylmuramate:L-alanyl-gamma-D-glutamyl-meso-diaminopimelate ligase [Deltaproteobacteria bacterium]
MTSNFVPDTVRHAEARRIHLIAICGVAMSALAGMLKQRGYEVSGSDENVYPPMSTVLERLGIEIRQGFGAENLADRPDLVVVGNKVSRNNSEVVALLESGIPYVSLPQALAELFIADRRSVVVGGTHGKTTSTAMLAWVLEQAGRDPSLMVGGEVIDFGGNCKLGRGEHFVIEGDEYDTAFFDKGPKFLHYRPQAVLLTAVEFDHADIYRDLDHVKEAFRKLVALLPAGAPLVVAADFAHARDVVRERRDVELFGLAEDADWRITHLHDDGATVFDVVHHGVHVCTARIQQPGAINARNALGVFVMARALGLSAPEILPGLASFRGVARRQEVVGELKGITLIDDFAHHPTAVAGTLAAMRLRYPKRNLWAVFEPRSNTSRRKIFQREYVEAFSAADRVIIGGVFQKDSDALAKDELFSPEQLARDLNERGTRTRAYAEIETIVTAIARNAKPGDVVVLMSNGGFGGLRQKLVAALG